MTDVHNIDDQPIYVINPNSTEAITVGIDRSLEQFRGPDTPQIICATLREGPRAIESQCDIDAVVPLLCHRIADLGARARAFVIACFSDPGLYSARGVTSKPVFGIAECGVRTALTLGHRFGVIAIRPASTVRHLQYFRSLGVSDYLAGDRPIDLGIAELADQERTFIRMVEVGKHLRDIDGADVLILGCAGMAPFETSLADALKIPVVEPNKAAVAIALDQIKSCI
jgi:allantoin racemase